MSRPARAGEAPPQDVRGCRSADGPRSAYAVHGRGPRLADLEAVADAAGLERFAMLGMSQGGPVGVAYAARHRGRLSRLILYGTYGRAMDHTDPQAVELEHTFC